MKKIKSKEDIKLFRRVIKKELKNILSNVEDHLDNTFAMELLNDDFVYICHMFAERGMTTPNLNRITNKSISVVSFKYGNGFDLNKHTSDYRLRKVVDRIIDEYNEEIDLKIEYKKRKLMKI